MKKGRDRLHLWFSLSYASWLVMPRVLMQEMPDEWQDQMAKLLEEWDETWDTSDQPRTIVQGQSSDGKFTKFSKWILNYRHPDKKEIEKHKTNH